MKRIYFFTAASTLCASMLLTACASKVVYAPAPTNSTPSSISNPNGVKVEDDICIVMQQEKPTTRAFGNGKHFKLTTARNIAMTQARAEFAANIAAAIIAATEEISDGTSKYAGDYDQGMVAEDQSSTTKDMVTSIAAEIVKGTAVIKTSTYMLPNRQYNVYVCLEYTGGKDALTEQTIKKVTDAIPENDAQKIRQRHDEFKQSILNYLEKNNGQTNNAE